MLWYDLGLQRIENDRGRAGLNGQVSIRKNIRSSKRCGRTLASLKLPKYFVLRRFHSVISIRGTL
jgi:hypothetical protein